ncbi:MAG: hypothetical protein G01um101438_925 [Parcubacteria group bacterium Gr01-1014_38]|nr:MAG: hypothetical protein G01um101438_925 [Parcubacteria group bacterium Gr01-1014_38]
MVLFRIVLGLLWATVVLCVWPFLSAQCWFHCQFRRRKQGWIFAVLGVVGCAAMAGIAIFSFLAAPWNFIVGCCAFLFYFVGWVIQLGRVDATGLGSFAPRW